MTPALKAMVEAMAVELERQVEENRGLGWDAALTGGPKGECRIDGRFELEKVARAGLEAIRRPSLGALAAAWKALGSEEECGVPVRDIYEVMMDAILVERP